MASLLSDCFNLIFPDTCRVCETPLKNISRVPVCPACFDRLEPFVAECICQQCGTPFASAAPLDEHGRCPLCRLGVRGYDTAFCYGAYGGVLRKLIHLFKYSGIVTLAAPLAGRLMLALPPGQVFDAVVPVPMHWRKRWKRGFNQAELLAGHVCRRSALPLVEALRRTSARPAQAGLSNAERRRNAARAFAPARGVDLKGRRVLLVDDVVTTGSTAAACASVLKKKMGAARVVVLAVARADRRLGTFEGSRLDRDPDLDVGSETDAYFGPHAPTGSRPQRQLRAN